MTQKTSVLLPLHITPIHYDIYLAPDLDNFIFIGEETIDLDFSKADSSITLHCAEIEVLKATVKVGKKETPSRRITYNKKAETVTISFPTKIPKGKAKLTLEFTGILNDKMRGFYRSRYEHDGKTYHMGVTQFESTDARRAFPCVDEPARKATFDVRLKVPIDRTVISNTLEEEILEHEGGYKVVKFERSPKMSSYLLAFIVGHFEYVEKITPEGVKVRVYVTPGKKKQAEFAVNTAAKLMSYFDKYFGIAYPMNTMDLIAIPDFANGAMENWGAVTYRESALLVDEEHSSLHSKQWVALIIAHELAHQWFGNLVTMQWWTHLWLNEGFASFMEYLAVDKLFPEWHIWRQFVYVEQAKALSLDGLENTHAIEIPVRNPAEISEIFDAVSYSKGASVIRMIESYIGEDNFRKGLQKYLSTHKFANAETEDLWRALETVSKKPVRKIMKNWTGDAGYPLIDVTVQGDYLHLSQKRFLANGNNAKKGLWLVPLSIVTDVSQPEQTLLNTQNSKLSGFGKAKWIKLNVGETSFVRLNYAPEILSALKKPVSKKNKIIPEEGRFALIRDIFALVESGNLSASEALNFMMAYKDETSYIVWAEVVTHLLEFRQLFFDEPIQKELNTFAQNLLQNIAKKSGWIKKKGETHEETLLRSTVTYALGASGDQAVIKHARSLFSTFLKSGKLDSDIRGIVFMLVAENGGEDEYKEFENIYMNSQMEEEKDRALKAMCSFRDKKLLKKTLTLGFSADVRAQDAFKVVYLMCNNPYGIDIVWEYVKDHWDEVVGRFAGGHLFARFISPFSKFKTHRQAEEFVSFFNKHSVEGIERTVAQTVEKIRSNADLVLRELPAIKKFLA